jgi:hypothetical protein
MATLDQAPNLADINMHISVIHLLIYHPSSILITIHHYANLSTEYVAAMEAARSACEEREHQEAED